MVGSRGLGEHKGAQSHDIYLRTCFWSRRYLDWSRVENSEMKIKFGGPFHKMIFEAMDMGNITRRKCPRRWGEKNREEDRGRERREEVKREEGGGRERGPEDSQAWLVFGEVWTFLTQPEENSTSSYHDINHLSAPVPDLPVSDGELWEFHNKATPCTTAQDLVAPTGTVDSAPADFPFSPMSWICLFFILPLTHRQAAVSSFRRLPSLLSPFSGSKTLLKELSIFAFFKFSIYSLLNSLKSQFPLHHSPP